MSIRKCLPALRVARAAPLFCVLALAASSPLAARASERTVQNSNVQLSQTLRVAALTRNLAQAKRTRCMVWDAVNDKCICWAMDDGSMQGDCNPQ